MSTAVPALLRTLIDDAALYPPGNAPMPVAVAEHRHHRAAPYGEIVGPLLVPASRWHELVSELADDTLDIGLIGPPGELLDAARAALAEPRVRLHRLECPADPAEAAAALDGLPAEVEIFVEVPRGPGMLAAVDACAEVGERHFYGAKLRTGGASAEAYPTEAELAAFIDRCLAHDHPFKLTAGLHRAVRHTEHGLDHHGYLNVLVAVCLGWLGRPYPSVEAALAERGPLPLVDAVTRMYAMPGEAAESRTWFWSYGSCSIAEPLADLANLTLLDPDLLAYLPARRESA